jgi:hypothetical protein
MKTQTEHTPGPWTYRDSNMRTWDIVASADIACRPIAEIPRPDNDDCGVPEADANARLIAAAPELLAALRGGADALREAGKGFALANPGVRPNLYELHEQVAREAIAKAQGGGL